MHDVTPPTGSIHRGRSRRRARPILTALLVVLAGAGLMGACGDDDTGMFEADDGAADAAADAAGEIDEQAEQVDDQAADLAATLREHDLETLASAVETLDVTEFVDGPTFTLFAPTDDAFLSLSTDTTTDLLTDPGMLLDVLESHLADETVTASELEGMDSVTTRTGAVFDVTVDGETIMVGDATVTTADIVVGDGVIHVIDAVLMP